MATKEQREAVLISLAEFVMPPCKDNGKYAKACKESIAKFIVSQKLTPEEVGHIIAMREDELQEAMERVDN